MLSEIEAGRVGTVITKDLSRLGRNSSLTGLYINYTFPQNDVRYIAINDHFDSINHNSTAALPLGDIEQELVTLCEIMTVQQKTALLTIARKMLENK